MKLRAIIPLMLWPELVFATAQTCTETQLHIHMFHAEQLTWQFSDVPASNLPRSWLEGNVNGRRLILFSPEHAVLYGGLNDWNIEIFCQSANGECEQSAKGDIPPDALSTSDALQRCMLGKTTEPEDALTFRAGGDATKLTITEAIHTAVADAIDSHSSLPPNYRVCERPEYQDLSASFALQALLIDLGSKIDFDGVVGPKTRTAAAKYLPAESNSKRPIELLADMQNRTCRQPDGSVSLKDPKQKKG